MKQTLTTGATSLDLFFHFRRHELDLTTLFGSGNVATLLYQGCQNEGWTLFLTFGSSALASPSGAICCTPPPSEIMDALVKARARCDLDLTKQ